MLELVTSQPLVKVNVRIPPDVHKSIKLIARERQWLVEGVYATALREFIERNINGKRKPK